MKLLALPDLHQATRLLPLLADQLAEVDIETDQPVLCVTGHIHEAIGVDTIGRTQVVNPGPLWKGGYAYIELVGEQVTTDCRRSD